MNVGLNSQRPWYGMDLGMVSLSNIFKSTFTHLWRICSVFGESWRMKNYREFKNLWDSMPIWQTTNKDKNTTELQVLNEQFRIIISWEVWQWAIIESTGLDKVELSPAPLPLLLIIIGGKDEVNRRGQELIGLSSRLHPWNDWRH